MQRKEKVEIEALYLLQKILLEKQWRNLSIIEKPIYACKEMKITSSGVSARRRRRRIDAQQRKSPPPTMHQLTSANKPSSSLIKNRLLKGDGGGYVKGFTSRELLTHSEVLLLSKKIQTGLYLEERKSRLKEKLGWEPTEEQVATSLRISRAELQIKQIECCLAREKLAMSNRIAQCLNMSSKKVRNATEAVNKVFSLDGQAFPSLNGLPGETLHSDEVNKLISTSLGPREEYIIRLYYGLDSQSLTWEDISRRIGLSRERVRQVGLVAVEKLKNAARKTRLDFMLVKY